ncbi:MAG: nucleoside recognition domain-containing protein [Verrucomicrobiota bacterium]|nr:nucleoside recognition domain-containing protein [Verrucomicrobiota bacterium]
MQAMRKYFPSKAAVIAYLLFILLYTPCLAVVGAVYRETNLKWTAFSVTYLAGVAWIVSTLFYQICQLSTTPKSALLYIVLCVGIIGTFIVSLRKIGNKTKIKEV